LRTERDSSIRRGDVRDLHGTVDREGAAIGVFISLEPPTAPMLTEAVSAGYYHSPGWNRDYPCIQLLTIDDLLRGKKIDMPPEHGTFKQAQKAEQQGQQHMLGL
jgi:site-specific DNA-methyltransferase (adenine-specific)